MNIDFHTHGKLAKYLPFSIEYTKLLFREARTAGLDALCLTEHFNTLEFEQVYNYIKNNYENLDDCFFVEGVKVFPGMEVDIQEGGHILVLGQIDKILAMNKELNNYKEKEHFIPLANLLDMAKAYHMLTGAAHAFREGSNIPQLEIQLLRNFDFIDLNGKDYATKKILAYDEIYEFGKLLQLPVVAGSDTHQAFQYGCIWNKFEYDCTKFTELKQVIKAGSYQVEILDYIDFKVKTASILKKALKEIHSCGGDYVSVMEL